MGRGVPKRWENYLPVGSRVPGTRFLPFKVPLKLELCKSQPEDLWFTPDLLVKNTPSLKAVIDLTDTTRYYNAEDFTNKGVYYKKINITGGGKLPSIHKRREFFDVVDQLCDMFNQDLEALIGVHCTHGLNRTGYLICKYMVSRMKMDPKEAISKFEEARGYTIERGLYVDDIITSHLKGNESWRQESSLLTRDISIRQESSRYISKRPESSLPRRDMVATQECSLPPSNKRTRPKSSLPPRGMSRRREPSCYDSRRHFQAGPENWREESALLARDTSRPGSSDYRTFHQSRGDHYKYKNSNIYRYKRN